MIRCYEIDGAGRRARAHAEDDVRPDGDGAEYLAHWLAERAAEEFDRRDEAERIIEVEGVCDRTVRFRVRRRVVGRYSAERIGESPARAEGTSDG